jgi:hypothetical protein
MNWKICVVLVLIAFGSFALAGYSLTLGAVLPGFDKTTDYRFASEAGSVIRRLGAQAGHVCGIVEVFIREGVGSVSSAYTRMEIMISDEITELSRNSDNIIFMVRKSFGSDVLGLLTKISSNEVALIVC